MNENLNYPVAVFGDLKASEVESFEKEKPLVYKKFTAVEKYADGYIFYSDRADPLEYVLKRYRKNKLVVLLRDINQILKTAKYELHVTGYYIIPTHKWSGTFYKRFNTYANRKKRTNAENKILDTYDNGLKITKDAEKDLKDQLQTQNWIYKYDAVGDYLYDTKYCALVKALEDLYLTVVFKNVSADCRRMEFGSIIPKKDYLKYDYFEPHLHLLYHCNKAKDSLLDVRVRSYLEKDISEYQNRLKEISYFQNYNSCSGLWPGIVNKNFDSDICFFDSRVKSYRNEQGKVSSLERLEAFNRFELTYVADPTTEEVLFKQIYENLKSYFKTLKLSFKAVKSGAWFDESLFSDRCYTIDFESPLGDRVLEIGNLSTNGDHYTHLYNIKVKNVLAVNGCSGVGIQRLAYVFLLNHGVKTDRWPSEIKTKYLLYLNQKIF